jgi:arginyl-tRNA synthetase
MRAQIEQAVKAALGVEVPFVVERPGDFAHGDYSTNAALVAKVDAKELAAKLRIDGVERVEVVGKFINFFLSRAAIIQEVENTKGIGQTHKGKKILVEYTQPNPFKEFHIGHLMSNAIGESLARLLETSGAKIERANYQGDVGPHVAKAIWGKMQMPDLSWGKAYTYGSEQYEAHKDEIDQINKKVYDKSDDNVNALYDRGRKESLAHFEELYKILGTKFDHYFFESETGPLGLDLIKKHPELFEQSEGATVFHGAHTRVFVTSKGLPTYEAKELGLAELKQKKAPSDLYVTVTATEQNGFFEVVFEAIQKIFPALVGRLTHRSHGMMRFADGKMSSRTGNVITGESLLRDLIVAAKEKMQGRELKDVEKTAEEIAVGAIKYTVLKQGSGRDIIFDPDKSLSLEGDSGPYLQYAHTRARSLLRKAAEATVTQFVTPHSKILERVLVHYPDVIERAAREMEPHYVTTYLTELAGEFNAWYAAERMIVDGQVSGYNLKLVTAVANTLDQGLHLLGIPAPEEM